MLLPWREAMREALAVAPEGSSQVLDQALAYRETQHLHITHCLPSDQLQNVAYPKV